MLFFQLLNLIQKHADLTLLLALDLQFLFFCQLVTFDLLTLSLLQLSFHVSVLRLVLFLLRTRLHLLLPFLLVFLHLHHQFLVLLLRLFQQLFRLGHLLLPLIFVFSHLICFYETVLFLIVVTLRLYHLDIVLQIKLFVF